MLISFILLALSLILVSTGILYPDLLIFLIGIILFFISSFQDTKYTRFFGWIASFILCITLFISSKSQETPTFSHEPSISPSIAAPIQTESFVYITPYGERYHYRSTCGGKNSKETTAEEAIAAGYTPCKKCVD